MTHTSLRLIVAGALFCAVAPMLQAAATTAPPGIATPAPAETFELGTMQIQKYGARGRPLILIPGLASGAWVWEDTVKRLQASHVLYVVTLAGFDGRRAMPGRPLEAAQAALLQLITARKLAKPVLIGHSLGGTLSLAFAEQHADLVSGVVSVDGLPVFPGSENVPPERRTPMASAMTARLAGMNQAAFEQQQVQYMRGTGVLDMAQADALAQLTSRSDPAAVVAFIGDVMATDLRAGLPAITVPVLLLAPYFASDQGATQNTEAGKVDYYRFLMHGTPQLEVTPIAPARHFAMFDQPERFAEILDAYLKKLD